MAAIARVTVEYLTHEVDHWCLTCQRGTGVRTWFVFRTIVGDRSVLRLQQHLRCWECGGDQVQIET